MLDGFPSMGAWVSYALGSVDDLPSFVIPDPRGVPQVGPNHWKQAVLLAVPGTPFNADKPIPNLATPTQITPAMERATRDLLKKLKRKASGKTSARCRTEQPHCQLRISRPYATWSGGSR